MKFANSIESIFKKIFPSPFTIAVLLNFLSVLLAIIYTGDKDLGYLSQSLTVIEYWEKGLWNSSLLSFTTQMMLMLVLGHSVALTKFANYIISLITRQLFSLIGRFNSFEFLKIFSISSILSSFRK